MGRKILQHVLKRESMDVRQYQSSYADLKAAGQPFSHFFQDIVAQGFVVGNVISAKAEGQPAVNNQ